MARQSFVWRDGKMIPREEAAPLVRHGVRLGRGPMVISDDMSPARHMASGKVHESNSQFRRDTRSHGCVELGNDAPLTRGTPSVKPTDARPDIAQAWQQLEGKL